MSTPVRIAAFVLGLAAVFGAALGVGHAVGPVGPAAPIEQDMTEHDTAGHEETSP